jgi:hypothetical protein
MARIIMIALLSACLACTGCTTTRVLPVPDATTDPSRLPKPGHRVVVTLRSGETREFRLETVEADALKGKNVRVPFADIKRIQEKEFHINGTTAGKVIPALAVVALAAMTLLVPWLKHAGEAD